MSPHIPNCKASVLHGIGEAGSDKLNEDSSSQTWECSVSEAVGADIVLCVIISLHRQYILSSTVAAVKRHTVSTLSSALLSSLERYT